MNPRLTVKDLLDGKGNCKRTQVNVRNADEALACEEAGIDMIITWEGNDLARIRDAAPGVFLTAGQTYGRYNKPEQALKAAYEKIKQGVDAIYCPQSLDYVRTLRAEGIPVVGHVGFIPYKKTWHGGFKAVGKTAAEALNVYESALAYQEAGAIAVEIEIVPGPIAREISGRLDILTIGMGAGGDTDAQYLFASDILGDTVERIPRHAKTYRNHRQEYERLHQDAIEAFREFRTDVDEGIYPAAEHMLEMNASELATFVAAIDERNNC